MTVQAKKAILFVEDNKELAKSLSGHLTEEGYAVTPANSGESALEELQKKEFAIVVLDLKLPKLSGFEVLKSTKKNFPKTKVIVLTAYADPMNITMCKELGSDEVIAKPYDLAFLFETIRSFLKG
jgi:DNA-binding response OmpR family regulator